jgi:bifunctional non-homologous end joining protein LigD
MRHADLGVAGCRTCSTCRLRCWPGRVDPSARWGEWQIEPKLDGYRAVIGVTPDDRVVRTRRGRNITDQLPELASLCDIGADLVLDGAVVSRSGAERLTFVAFDLLRCQGFELLDRPLHERRRLLEHVAGLADGVLGCP